MAAVLDSLDKGRFLTILVPHHPIVGSALIAQELFGAFAVRVPSGPIADHRLIGLCLKPVLQPPFLIGQAASYRGSTRYSSAALLSIQLDPPLCREVDECSLV